MLQDDSYQVSSGNIFADLGIKNPDKMLEKAALVSEIIESIDSHGLIPGKACQVLEIEFEQLYALRKGKFNVFSLTQLTKYLTALQNKI